MKRILSLVILIFTLTSVDVSAQVSDRWDCDDLASYYREVTTSLDRDDMLELQELMETELDRLRPSELRDASALLDEWATALDDMPASDIPKAAREYHKALVESLGTLSAVYNAVASGNVLTALAYTDALEQLALDLDSATTLGSQRCSTDWPF
jgi:hypothetical protein